MNYDNVSDVIFLEWSMKDRHARLHCCADKYITNT